MGYHPDEIVGMNVLDHVHPDGFPHILEETQKTLAEGGITNEAAEYRFHHKDRSWRHVESVGTYLLDDPHVRGVVVVSRDVTQRKGAEKALRESEAEIFSILESITDAFFALAQESWTCPPFYALCGISNRSPLPTPIYCNRTATELAVTYSDDGSMMTGRTFLA